MDPSVMNSMMDMMKNPQLMTHMNDMMKNPKIQEMMNNPELINGMMNMFGDKLPPGMNLNEDTNEESTNETSETDADVNVELIENKAFSPEDIVVLNGLKNDAFNGRTGAIVSYNEDKSRYVVQLDNLDDTSEENRDQRIMVKEENLQKEPESVEVEEAQETEEIINID
jgi:hypothetical protein